MASVDRGVSVLDAGLATRPRIITPQSLLGELRGVWQAGLPGGDKTGWPSLDKHYTVAPGQFTVVTGWPSSGKSEWLDALLVNLSHQGWRFAMFSPENMPVVLHLAKLMEKLAGKPFGNGPTPRLTLDELGEFADDLQSRFAFMESVSGGLTAQAVMETAEKVFAGFDTGTHRGLVIDPWNELEHWRPSGLSETEYVSMTLSAIRQWARAKKVHVWIVAHPQKMRKENGQLPIPRPDMISGSQHWWNKADNAITVWRDFEKLDSAEVDIYVQKVRFKHIGRPGFITLNYDRITGRYREPSSLSAVAYNRMREGDE